MAGTGTGRRRGMSRRLPFFLVLLVSSHGAARLSCGGSDDGTGGGAPMSPVDAAIDVPAVATAGTAILVSAAGSTGEIERYRFDFGDGTKAVASSSPFVLHRFPRPGRFEVTVTAQRKGSTSGASAEAQVVAGPGPTVRFDFPADRDMPSWGEVPYPSDLLRDAAGRLAVHGVRIANDLGRKAIETALSDLTGFGTTTAAFFWADADLDPISLPETPEETVEPGSPVFLLNVDPASARYRERHPVLVDWNGRDRVISVLPEPGVPLDPKTTYAAVVTTGLWGASGSLGAPETFATLLAGRAPQVPYGEEAREIHARLLDALDGEPDFPGGRAAGRIAGAAVFTTQKISDDVVAIRDSMERGDPGIPDPDPRFDPAWVFGRGGQASLDELLGVQPGSGPGLTPKAHDRISTIVTRAFFPSPRYLSDDVHFLDLYGGRFVVEDGEPVVQGVWDVPFTIVLPDAPVPPAGYPVLIAGHGLGGTRADDTIHQANAFAAAGFVVVGMDAVQHGDRYDISNLSPAVLELAAPILEDLGFRLPLEVADERPNYPGSLSGPDGWPDPNNDGSTFAFVSGIVNLPGFRDNFRQSTVDQMQFARMLARFDEEIPGAGRVKLDPGRIYYMGTSLGGIMGASFVSLEPTVRAAVLNNGGGGLGVNLLANSPGIGGRFGDLIGLAFGVGEEAFTDPFSPLVNLFQTVLEAGDPVNLARHAIRDPVRLSTGEAPTKSVLLVEVMWDHLVPNEATEALARAFGLSLLEPWYRPVKGVPSGGARIEGNAAGRTAALVQQSPAEHGTNLANLAGQVYYEMGFPFGEGERFPPVARVFSIRNPVEAGVAQVVDFILGVDAGGPGVVETKMGYAPRHDYDDDGFPDDAETAAGTDRNDPESHP